MFLFDANGEVIKATPANPKALEFGEAIVFMVVARMSLDLAKQNVPHYTAQWNDEDYYSQEQENYNRAADRVLELFKELHVSTKEELEENEK